MGIIDRISAEKFDNFVLNMALNSFSVIFSFNKDGSISLNHLSNLTCCHFSSKHGPDGEKYSENSRLILSCPFLLSNFVKLCEDLLQVAS